ncbi:MAG: hypothetical protein J7L55_03450 [Desulfurococcales archaeon]|nr:hypothetical protein [Desulfurococcales archaeon]
MSEEGTHFRKVFVGEGNIDKIMIDIAKGLADARITPQDLTNPVAFQLAFSRLYKALLKSIEEGSGESYIAEIKFTDDLGNEVVFTVNLGEEVPAFASKRVKARVTVELFEEYE